MKSAPGHKPAKSDGHDYHRVAMDPGKSTSPSGKDPRHATATAASDLRRANTVAQARNIRASNRDPGTGTDAGAGAGTARVRTTATLLRAKDSREGLRQNSLKRSNTHAHQTPRTSTGARQAKHFTVGNVGQNGKIFLR